MVCNFTDKTLSFDAPENFQSAEMILSNYNDGCSELMPYEAVMLYYEDVE